MPSFNLLLQRYVGWLAATAMLAGCTTVGPDFRTPDAPVVARYTREAPLQRVVMGEAVAPEWWTAFGSPRLDDLVKQALHDNFTLAAAEATLRQAQQLHAAQAGSTLYPTVNARLGASRNQANAAGRRTRWRSFASSGRSQFPPRSPHLPPPTMKPIPRPSPPITTSR